MSCLNYLKSMFQFSTVCCLRELGVYGRCKFNNNNSPFTTRARCTMMMLFMKHEDRQTQKHNNQIRINQ